MKSYFAPFSSKKFAIDPITHIMQSDSSKNKYKPLYLILLLATLVAGCVKENIIKPDVTPPTPPVKDTTTTSPGLKTSTSLFLGHKGAGSNNYNDLNMEHSIASFKQALQYLDGVEIDAQMSLDSTIWLFHDTDVNASLCSPGTTHQSILTMHDKDIAALKLCSRTKSDRVYKFSELMDLWNNSTNGFYIDIEIKQGFDKGDYTAFGGETKYLTAMARAFANNFSTLNHNGRQLQIEDYNLTLTTELRKTNAGKKVSYFLNNGKKFVQNVSDALTGGFDGVICDFTDATITAALVRSAHDKGLLVSLYTPYTDAEVTAVYNMLPDFIDTDHYMVKKDLGLK